MRNEQTATLPQGASYRLQSIHECVTSTVSTCNHLDKTRSITNNIVRALVKSSFFWLPFRYYSIQMVQDRSKFTKVNHTLQQSL